MQINIDVIAVQVAQNLFTSYYKILNAAMKEQLPGGAFYTLNSEKITETSSVFPHNKLPERAFGMLDFLIRNRPNATTLTNEAFILFAFNKTCDWLEELPLDEKNHLLNISKTQGRQIRETFKERYREIERQRLEALKKKQEDLVKRKERFYKKKKKGKTNISNNLLWIVAEQHHDGTDAPVYSKGIREKKSSCCTTTFPFECFETSCERQIHI